MRYRITKGAMEEMPLTRALKTEGTEGKEPDITPYTTDMSIMPKQRSGRTASLNAEGKRLPVTLSRMAWGAKAKNAITAK